MVQRSSDYIIRATVRYLTLSAAALFMFMAASARASAQDSYAEDTVNISAVTITARASARLAPFTVVKMDAELLSGQGGGDLASLLQSSSNLFVRRNGNQGLASVSVRGMSGSHTLVTWNDLPLNSPGNGFSDFTIIPLHAVSTVRITSGGSDLDDVSGYIGGKVDLASEPQFDAGTDAAVTLGAGSYGEFTSSASFTRSGARFYSRLGAWTSSGANDFRFINEDAPGGPSVERRSNAAFSGSGMTGDLSYRQGASILSTHLWLSDSDRELPGPVTTVQQNYGERQTDRSFRGVMKYSLEGGRFTAGITAGGSHDINRYYHMVPSNNGNNSSSLMMLKLRLGYRVTTKTGLVLNAGDTYERASALSFDSNEKRNLFSVSVAARSNPVPRLNLLFQVRQVVVTDAKMAPEFTAGASWMLSRSGEHLLKMSISHNSKLPCFNDLYWIPGGNPELTPETSAGGEISWSFAETGPSGNRNSLDIVLHASRVDGLIQWIPGQSGLWHAVNLRSVNVSGIEARAARHWSAGTRKLHGWVNYALTRSVIAGSEIANDRSAGNQLIYAPLHHANINFTAGRAWLRTGISSSWESRRYTTSDNSEWLPSAFITEAFAGAIVPAGPIKLQADLIVNNLPGIPFESVRNYPMPLRTFLMKITLTWSDKPKKDENDH